MAVYSEWKHWLFMILSTVGIFVGLAGFFVFVFTYENYQAGFLAGFSGILSALCLHLHLLDHFDLVEKWYTPVIMRRVTIFAATILVASVCLLGWYLGNVISKHQGFYPLETSNAARAVMSFLNLKWAVSLVVVSAHFRREMVRRAFSYQTISESDDRA